MKVLLLSLLFLVGCGDLEQFQESKKDGLADEMGEGAEEQPSEVTGETNVNVNVEVNVEVNSYEGSAEEIQVIFAPKRRTFSEAQKAAPEGYRLLTRSEFVLLSESGYLAEYDDVSYAWSSTVAEDYDDENWAYSVAQDRAYPYDHEVYLPSFYISEFADL
jgi:hypothetical protein